MGALVVGTGVVRTGDACATLGSAAHMGALADVLPPPGYPPVVVLCHPATGLHFWHGVGLTGGLALEWIRRVVSGEGPTTPGGEHDISISSLIDEAGRAPAGSRGLLFLPYLNGVAVPHYDPLARACFVGGHLSHSRADFIRAVLEGVAYNVRDAFEAFRDVGCRISRIRIGEGGTRSGLWCQILADVLGHELEVLREAEASALGAAIIAGVGAGVYPSFEEACARIVQTASTVSPDPTRRQVYSDRYSLYKDLYPQLAPTFRALGQKSCSSR
jgi:xylulokinase